MSSRYQTYELIAGVFGTYDSDNEDLPTEYLNGPFDVIDEDAQNIQDGALIEIIDGQAVITPQADA